ncbi:MAG: hypothetical protein ACYSW3_00375 [Planctomycetota bacterium]|jgi:hypothetical protein
MTWVVGIMGAIVIWLYLSGREKGSNLAVNNPEELLNNNFDTYKKYPNSYGWICTTCDRHHGPWTGKCRCGEVRLVNNET